MKPNLTKLWTARNLRKTKITNKTNLDEIRKSRNLGKHKITNKTTPDETTERTRPLKKQNNQ